MDNQREVKQEAVMQTENLTKLPTQSYILVRGNAIGQRIGLVKAGESGYYQMSEPYSFRENSLEKVEQLSLEKVEQFVDAFNRFDGVTRAQRLAMEWGSMFGWDTALANPEHEANQR